MWPLPTSAATEGSHSERVRSNILCLLCDAPTPPVNVIDCWDVQGILLHSIRNYLSSTWPDPATERQASSDFTVPLEISEALSKVSIAPDIRRIQSGVANKTKLGYFLSAWIGVHTCLENPKAGSACKCPYLYIFIKYSLDRCLGVPKLALALYDRMNMQLSKEFIRCQPHFRAQQAGQVDRSGEVQAVQPLQGCDLLQSRVSGRPLPRAQKVM